MLHLETYKAEATRKANSRWYRDDPPPEGLLNPTGYVERMVGDKVSLLQTRQRLEALRELGHYKGDVAAPWGAAATDALKQALTALAVGVDGKWGPETEDAIQTALAAKNPARATEGATADADEDAPPQQGRDALPMRIVGTIVAGAAVSGIVAAILVTRRRRRALGEARDGV